MAKVEITNSGIQKTLKKHKFDPLKAIAEYVWNGFDAGATEISIVYESNSVGFINQLSIVDNGKGIEKELLIEKFKPFYDSKKKYDSNHSLPHGRNGFGRLTFIEFAQQAKWQSTYLKNDSELKTIEISVKADNLIDYKEKDITDASLEQGTTVIFTGIHNLNGIDLEQELRVFLEREFGWFLKLNNNHKININAVELEINNTVDKDKFEIICPDSQVKFEIVFVQWKEKQNEEYSKFYFKNSKGQEIWKKNTTLNNKGDGFYHSVYIQSDFFDSFEFESKKLNGQTKFDEQSTVKSEEYIFLEQKILDYLNRKRRPYLEKLSEKLINQYTEEGVIIDPSDMADMYQKYRVTEVIDVTKELFKIEPKIFSNFNIEQKKTFVGLLSNLLDSGRRESILKIISSVIDLSLEDLNKLKGILENVELRNIVLTLELLENRYSTIADFKELVFNPELAANEIDHVQKMVESNFWLFGEEYSIVTAAEPKFEEALRRYWQEVFKKEQKKKIDHPDKNKEMDIFAIRQRILNGEKKVENIVLELKSPKVSLGEKELAQIKKYLRVIKSTDEFNSTNASWNFYLVGNNLKIHKGDKTPYIQDQINSFKYSGYENLAYQEDDLKFKVFVLTWSDIFNTFEINHSYITEKLKLKRENLTSNFKNAEEIINKYNKES